MAAAAATAEEVGVLVVVMVVVVAILKYGEPCYRGLAQGYCPGVYGSFLVDENKKMLRS